MNIIVSTGHGLNDPGAVSGEIIEHLHTYWITWHLREELETKGHQVEFISCFQPLSAKIRTVNELHQIKSVDLAIEIHFNSVDNITANGTEVLYYSQSLVSLATKVSAALSTAISTANRGAKHRTDLGWLKQTQPRALIVEVCFISSAIDAGKMKMDGFHKTVALAIAGAI